MRAALVTLALMLSTCMAWAGEAAAPAKGGPSVVEGMGDFERNTALGAVLATRPGTPAELAETRMLADRGLKAAQALVAEHPDSADAQYLLGSWLLYGYRVVEVEQISFDATGGQRTQTVSRVIQGMSDDPAPGLAALKKSTELAPNNGEYLLDYAAALGDYGQLDLAGGILKGIWAGQPALSLEQKMHAGFLLAGVAEAEGDYGNAREWIYSALSLNPATAEAVERLRGLDAEETAAQEAAGLYEEAPSTGEEVEGQPSSAGPEENQGSDQGYDESYDQGYDSGSYNDGSGDQSYDQGYGDGSYDQGAGDQSYDQGSGDGSYSDGSGDQSYDQGAGDGSYDQGSGDQSSDGGADSGNSYDEGSQ
jgi:hypothetical protein